MNYKDELKHLESIRNNFNFWNSHEFIRRYFLAKHQAKKDDKFISIANTYLYLFFAKTALYGHTFADENKTSINITLANYTGYNYATFKFSFKAELLESGLSPLEHGTKTPKGNLKTRLTAFKTFAPLQKSINNLLLAYNAPKIEFAGNLQTISNFIEMQKNALTVNQKMLDDELNKTKTAINKFYGKGTAAYAK